MVQIHPPQPILTFLSLHAGIAQLARASAFQAEGRGFESRFPLHFFNQTDAKILPKILGLLVLKLNQVYFRNFLVIFFITLFFTTILGYFILKNIETNNHKMMLKNLIEEFSVFEKTSQKNLPVFIKNIKEKTGVRVTIIDRNGKVLFESDTDAKKMENHLNRPEIKEALKKSYGSSVRFSTTLNKDLLYVAKYQENRFIRMAYPLESIQEKFIRFWMQTVLLFGLTLAISLFVAYKINQNVTSDLKLIKKALQNLLQSRYDVLFDDIKCCKEFAVIYDKIIKVAKKLKRRDEQKTKFTKRLKEVSKKQGDIISAISHEFKNPVAAILGYAQTIEDDDNLSPQIRKKFIKKVISNAQKISNMIDRLSLAVKIESDNLNIQKSEFRIKPLLEDVKETLLQKYKDRQIIVEAKDIKIVADKTMMENLLINLTENALKYSEDEVVIKVDEKKLEVIDKGIGIESENLKKITDRFYRVDTLSWDNSIGVGLYIVKYILKLHNSELKIDSVYKKGSTFWFSLKNMRR